MHTSIAPSPNRSLHCVSQWGQIQRNDAVVMRRNNLHAGLEVFLPPDEPSLLNDWTSYGYRSSEEFQFWSRKVCGLACLQSLLHGWTDVRFTMGELLTLALDWDCFVMMPSGNVQGLVYRPFMSWINAQFGFECELIENTTIAESGDLVRPGRVMIASVSAEIRDESTPEPQPGGHLVLVYAVEDGVVWFHNPSGYSHNSESASLPIGIFERFHANRGVLVAASS